MDEVQVYYVIYDPLTGEISQWGHLLNTVLESLMSVDPNIATYNPEFVNGEAIEVTKETHWVNNGVVELRPTMAFDKTAILANGTDAAVLTLDRAFTIYIDDVPTTISSSPYQVTLKTTVPASYVIKVECFPYKILTTKVVAS